MKTDWKTAFILVLIIAGLCVFVALSRAGSTDIVSICEGNVTNCVVTRFSITNTLHVIFPDSSTNTPPAQQLVLVPSGPNPVTQFWVRADTINLPGVIRVDFYVDGLLYHTENLPPWCLFADNGTCNLDTLAKGTHTIVAKAYSSGGLVATSLPLTVVVV